MENNVNVTPRNGVLIGGRSAISICNRALSKIGDDYFIASFNENSKAARACASLYDDTKKQLLRAHPWRFALKRFSIPALTEKPVFGYDKMYQMPNECLRVWRPLPINVDYVVEGMNILVNGVEGTFRFQGIVDVKETYFDAMFVEALALKLASELSVPIANSAVLRDSFSAEFRDYIKDARTTNSFEAVQDKIEMTPSWLEDRF